MNVKQYLPIFVLGFLMLTGCGGSNTITGSATCDGVPLASGRIMFVPESGRQISGRIENGNIVDLDAKNGVPAGRYTVGIYAFTRERVGMEFVPSLIDLKYNDPSTSELEIEVKDSEANHFTFELDPRKNNSVDLKEPG